MLKLSLFFLKAALDYGKQMFDIFKQLDINIKLITTIVATQNLLSQTIYSLAKIQVKHKTTSTIRLQPQIEDLLTENQELYKKISVLPHHQCPTELQKHINLSRICDASLVYCPSLRN